MTVSPQHQLWLDLGLDWHLALPLLALRNRLRRYGYTVFDIGNNRHLDHEPPEDHTPYSETGWPIHTPYGWVTAIDVMPPPAGSPLPSLAELGWRIHDDRQAGVAGVAWLKYMNWEPGDGKCWHESWQPAYVRRSSSDRGHLHLSCRSDMVNSAAAADYDPIQPPPSTEVVEMIFEVTAVPKGAKDIAGTVIPEHGQCLATPSGPFGLSGTEFFSLPQAAQAVRIHTTWERLLVLCEGLNPAIQPAAPAKK